ncbi:MAG: 50S ribosomal protein L25 [Candidatus Peregrinibacteria bacterium]
MADMIILSATKRDLSGKIKDLRASGLIPGVIYGHLFAPIPVSVEYQPFRKAFRDAGESTILSLEIDGKVISTLVHDVQYDPILDTFLHIDFYAVQEKEALRTHVPLVFEGVSPAIKNLAGVLNTTLESIEISCLPKHLIHNVIVDISVLENFHTVITVGDLPIAKDKNIEIITDLSTPIASVMPPRVAEAAETPTPAK